MDNFSFAKDIRESGFDPSHVDQLLRSSIQMAWMLLPNEDKNNEAFSDVMNSLYNRAMKNFLDDHELFKLKIKNKPLKMPHDASDVQGLNHDVL